MSGRLEDVGEDLGDLRLADAGFPSRRSGLPSFNVRKRVVARPRSAT
jgi:hypothetical protein